MQKLYRILVKPYSYDLWDIFTEDKEIFDQLKNLYDIDDARDKLGNAVFERLCDCSTRPTFPYILLDEIEVRQYA